MKINAVYLKEKKLPVINRADPNLLIVLLTMIISVITGSVVPAITGRVSDINKIMRLFFECNSRISSVETFFIYFSHIFLFIIVCFISGASLYGKIPIILTVFYKLCGISSITTMFIKYYLLEGFEYILLVFLPGKMLLIFIIIYYSTSCLKVSKIISDDNQLSSEKFDKVLYTKKLLFSIIIAIISALTDTALFKIFSPLFEFK